MNVTSVSLQAGRQNGLQVTPQFGKVEGPFQEPPASVKLNEWPRALSSFGKLNLAWFPLLNNAPEGDGHPVVVLPGFMTGDATTLPLRKFLTKLDYDVHNLSLGINTPINQRYSPDELVAQVIDVYNKTGKKVSLVGWSLGGLQAREIAKRVPNMVRDVVTLGSPLGISAHEDGVNHSTKKMFDRLEKLTGVLYPERMMQRDIEFMDHLHEAPPVPVTSVYSKKDGVASWKLCVQESEYKNTKAPVENVEVKASHLGMGHDPSVLYLVAERLAQPEGEWQPFDRNGGTLRPLIYPEAVNV